MIGTVKKKIHTQQLHGITCSHCNRLDTVFVHIYTTMFILKILPFATGKDMGTECISCKKAFDSEYTMPPPIWLKANDIKAQKSNPWYTYIGYAFLGLIILIALLK